MNILSDINILKNELATPSSTLSPLRQVKTSAIKVVDRLRSMQQIHTERQQLSELSPRLLADIGIDAEDAKQELARSYFDLPDGR